MLLSLSVLRAILFGVLAWNLACGVDPASAQTDVAPELKDRPPVAAPTAKIETGAIPVVLSESQEVDNFASGLMQGLMVGSRAKGVGLVIVKDDHVIVQRVSGAIAQDLRFPAGALSDVFAATAVMQQVERGRLMLAADISTALGETSARGMTLEQVLAFQAGDSQLLPRAVEKASGAPWSDYFAKEFSQPLAMNATRLRDSELETNLEDMSHFAIALVNGGVFQNGRILTPASVELMESTHAAPHPLLPGAAYGFTEMRRHGWRALQHDGRADGFASRLVVVPDAKIAYFIVAEGSAGADFWSALDNNLFDKLLPEAAPGAKAESSRVPAPTEADAETVAGRYEAIHNRVSDVAPLKLGARLTVRPGAGATLVLTGAQSATLVPRPGGYWSSADDNVIGVPVMGELMLSTGIYGRLALYKRPEIYLGLALLALLTGGGVVVFDRRRTPPPRFPSNAVLGLAGLAVIFLLLSGFVFLFAPGA